MAVHQVSESPLLISITYQPSPVQIQSLTIANPTAQARTVRIRRSNGVWVLFNVPARSLATVYPLTASQYSATVSGGVLNNAPNIEVI